MARHGPDEVDSRPAGYAALLQRYGLSAIPNWHRSRVGGATRRVEATGTGIVETYPSGYWPGDDLGDHLTFALKYDGTNLAVLDTLFSAVDPEELGAFVRRKETGKYARRLWFLFEFLTGKRLPLEDLKRGNYVSLLDPEAYYTVQPARKVRRQRIDDNLLGDRRFCPTVRRTEALRGFEAKDLPARCRHVLSAYPDALLKRALAYLYAKETKSSFELENLRLSSTRTARFVALLHLAETEDFCQKTRLIEVQNRIVPERSRDADYRSTQVYVGQTVIRHGERIHFVGPRPDDIHDLCGGLIAAHKRMGAAAVSVVVHAAVVAYGFVFLHPFGDGNGRIHRFLIHNVFALRKFTPPGVIFPVSATMLRNTADYDESLEAFSKALMPFVRYELDDEGRMVVENDTARWYRYMDMTAQVEALFRFVEQTIDTDLAEELAFLANYDETKKAIQDIVDMPDREIDLFIRFCLQNHRRLSDRKRESHFAFLTDDELASMEAAVQSAYGTSEIDRGSIGELDGS